MGIVLEAKKQLEAQGCNPEMLENAFKAYGSQDQLAWERVKFLEAEVAELKEELNESYGASRRFVDTMESTLEKIVNLDLNDKVKFKEMQHELYRILDIINLLKRLS